MEWAFEDFAKPEDSGGGAVRFVGSVPYGAIWCCRDCEREGATPLKGYKFPVVRREKTGHECQGGVRYWIQHACGKESGWSIYYFDVYWAKVGARTDGYKTRR